MTQTTLIKPAAIARKKYKIDAQNYTLGRLAVRIAKYLQGKQRVEFTPYSDNGDFVYVENAALVKFTGNKLTQNRYTHYSGYPGGISRIALKDMMKKSPEFVVREAVRGMLPKNKLRKFRLRRLKFLENKNASVKFDGTIK